MNTPDASESGAAILHGVISQIAPNRDVWRYFPQDTELRNKVKIFLASTTLSQIPREVVMMWFARCLAWGKKGPSEISPKRQHVLEASKFLRYEC